MLISRILPERALLQTTVVVLAAGVWAACTSVGSPERAGETEGPPPVVLERGQISRDAQARAGELVAAADEAFQAGRAREARTLAQEVVDDYPQSAVSGDALALVAGASAELGDWDAAADAATRLRLLLPPGDARVARMTLVEGRALRGQGRSREALERLLSLSPDAAPSVLDEALGVVRELSDTLPRDTLGEVLQATPLGQPLAAPVMTAYARGLLLAGDAATARSFAQAALDGGAAGEDAEAARAVLEGRVVGAESAPARLGALLPLTGSPAMRDFAGKIRDGIEAAVTAADAEGTVELTVLDNGGDPGTSGALVASAQGQGVVALVGPLQDDAVAAAASARRDGLPVISPTAYETPPGAGSVYSLAALDPGAAQALASWAAGAGIRQVVLLHASRGNSPQEARVFADRFQTLGGSVLRDLSYEPGATFFRQQIEIVQGLKPEALVLPVPPEDVPALASQMSFFGLDTLGVQILGTAGWTDDDVRRNVSRRHLDGVVAATPQLPGQESPGYRRFVDAYESHFQRSLVDPTVTALGYDAASLLLLALRSGARTPAALGRALEDIQGFQGATGSLSIVDGKVVREQQVVCLWGGELLPMAPGARPQPVYRPYPPDPETDSVPEGPGRRAGFSCPGIQADSVGGGH